MENMAEQNKEFISLPTEVSTDQGKQFISKL